MGENPQSQQGGMNVNPYDALLWRPWRKGIGLNEGQWANLTNLVGMHMVLDRLLSIRILSALCSLGKVEKGGIGRLATVVADMTFGRRLDLARESGLLTAEAAEDLKEVNRVRNSLMHFKPKMKGRLGDVPEINSDEALKALTQRGLRAFEALMKGDPLHLFEDAAKADEETSRGPKGK